MVSNRSEGEGGTLFYPRHLTDAIIVSIKPFVPIVFLKENEPYRHMEEISFTYRKIKWRSDPDSKEAEDDWEVPSCVEVVTLIRP